jgi:hypothetical protein
MGEGLDRSMPNPCTPAARRAERVGVNAEVALRRSGQLNYRVHAYDASPFGCKLEFVERPELDERVWVKFEGLDAIEGHVCWIDGFVVGVEFERPIYEAVFNALIPRLL